ncbi:hypothetical protein Leryth_015091, partial [Lithospermum erythrorhizon]
NLLPKLIFNNSPPPFFLKIDFSEFATFILSRFDFSNNLAPLSSKIDFPQTTRHRTILIKTQIFSIIHPTYHCYQDLIFQQPTSPFLPGPNFSNNSPPVSKSCTQYQILPSFHSFKE